MQHTIVGFSAIRQMKSFPIISHMGTFGVQYAQPLVLAEWELARGVERRV